MSPDQLQSQKLFTRCFTKEELEFLQLNAEFIEATKNLKTLAEALDAVELGERLTRDAWCKLNYPEGASHSCSNQDV